MPKSTMPESLPLEVWGSRLLLKAVGADVVNDKIGSLYVPAMAQDRQRHMRWEIVAVGDNVYDPLLAPGLQVLASKWATTEIAWEGERYRVVYEADVIAAVTGL